MKSKAVVKRVRITSGGGFRLECRKEKQIFACSNCLICAQNDEVTVLGFICSQKTGKLYLIMFFPSDLYK